ncbi:MAG TPA: ribonuclease III [Candidatus Binatia bacterium]|nr:ribonuclease III [Candidatus Binatia bacterium]
MPAATISEATLGVLCRALGYEFRAPELLRQALTHRSASGHNNERLEFLGDALLNLAAAELLYRTRPDAEEGALSRLRAGLVREESLAAIGEGLPLGEALILGPGELKSGGFRRHSILADAVEALVGAVYLDGGFDAARDLCGRLLADRLARLPDDALLKDSKTRLQEWLQARGRALPLYEVIDTHGPSHRQSFTVTCRLADSGDFSEGRAESRRGAEQQAAEKLLARLEQSEHGAHA